MIQLIYAYAGTKTVSGENEFAFGINGGLPWGHIPQDLKNFKARTEGTTLIMGAKTFSSFPKPLVGRPHVVVCDLSRDYPTTQDGSLAHFYISDYQFDKFLNGHELQVSSPNADFNAIFSREEGVYSVIGGAGLLQQAYPFSDKVIQTSIRKRHRVNSDTQLPMSFIVAPAREDSGFLFKESHYYHIDAVTNISEDVYVKTGV
ncbi:dihydrofolate reductase [Escherichia phage EcS1]|uniref:dihydrofolate reductase n=1 Tax=Escherichia phage EcS1 TaxID=2083276 RepID=A0A2Z5ZCU9_9CAUD|nr:dihydrofolate reductase [Escherichia phage EcS1]BBC78304.1 Dihydrofolate reductase [Escherichia phage EcS1]